ncbi:MAG TPA: cysteine peptidase family C39 domain-containing protein [Blastocatellia bacterium]|nr:cysteine peptidase family C39 domain-containing protein [Blastocatellia bacterium]
MVLLALGVDVPERQLRVSCDTTLLGTDALKAIDAARQLAFEDSAKHTLTLDELKNLVEAGHNPIVFVSLLPIDARDDFHALVVIEFRDGNVLVLDPLVGERTIPELVFNAAWGMRHQLAILIATRT